MSVTLTTESGGLLVIVIAGTYTFADQQRIEAKARAEVAAGRRISLLVLAQDFTGWDKEGDWGDLSFMYEIDASIEKMAVVAKGQWKGQILMFVGAGRRQAQVEFFHENAELDARKWLQGDADHR